MAETSADTEHKGHTVNNLVAGPRKKGKYRGETRFLTFLTFLWFWGSAPKNFAEQNGAVPDEGKCGGAGRTRQPGLVQPG